MPIQNPAWYCARTKPKHEHIAANNVSKALYLDVFNPRMRSESVTRRGLVRTIEPLFPCYIFIRCIIEERLNDIQHTNGINRLVRFGEKIPHVAEQVIQDLKKYFQTEEPLVLDDAVSPGDDVVVSSGAFSGMSAKVLRILPTVQRVQILLNILGGPTLVEVERTSVVSERGTVAARASFLAAPI